MGDTHCPLCSRPIVSHSKDDIVKLIYKDIQDAGWHKEKKKIAGVAYNDSTIDIFAPVVQERKGEYFQLLYDLLGKGYESVRVDGKVHSLHNTIEMNRNKKHTIEALVDTLHLAEKSNNPTSFKKRLAEAIEKALNDADGRVTIHYPDGKETLLSSRFFCPYDGGSLPEVEPRLFSFNSPVGACDMCKGLGTIEEAEQNVVCPSCKGKRLRKEALSVYVGSGKQKKEYSRYRSALSRGCVSFSFYNFF